VKVAITLEYDGSAYCGWQTQPGGCAVQDHLERALAQIAGSPVATICAGRTDAGVHALMQTVHFECPSQRPESAWVRDFNARYSATGRRYLYALLSRPVRPALDSRRVGWTHHSLDESNMLRAATVLLGKQDFSAFRSAECQAQSPVRELREITIVRHGELLLLEFAANAFLHHMVRNLVGALVQVGSGRQSPGWLKEVLDSRDRSRSAPTFAPDGLYLAQVEYPERFGIPVPSIPVFRLGTSPWQPL